MTQTLTHSPVKVFETKPEGFSSSVHMAACYVEAEGRLLVLKLGRRKRESGTWGAPAGKIDPNESVEEGARRELFEETGIALEPHVAFQDFGEVYISKPYGDFIYHLFSVHLPQCLAVALSEEHTNYTWALPEELERLPMVPGFRGALAAYHKRSSKKARPATRCAVYLIVQKQDKVLLLARQNTGYKDGEWSLIAGHVEEGESAKQAMVREAYEEAGIRVSESDLEVVHVMHRASDRPYIDLFFRCHTWEGEIINREPEKCAALEYFPLDQLPANTVDYLREAFRCIQRQIFYSELGF
jgi:8-oxo-dGTP pyrophosphatase MutT (NUDIX family)